MKLETSQKLCTFFACANFLCYWVVGDPLNLYIGISMGLWVVVLDFMGNVNV